MAKAAKSDTGQRDNGRRRRACKRSPQHRGGREGQKSIIDGNGDRRWSNAFCAPRFPIFANCGKVLGMKHTTPPGYGEEAAAFWQAVMADFILDHHEIALLTAAARCLDEAAKADEILEYEGRLVGSGPRGADRPNPMLKHARDSRLALAHIVGKLKLDKAAAAPAAPLRMMKNRRMIGVGKS